MMQYPKQPLSLQQILDKLSDSGMTIDNPSAAEAAIQSIGFYRLRGYYYYQYDKTTKRFTSDIKFSDLLARYSFDHELSHLIFNMTSQIEVALRARLVCSLLLLNDPLALGDPSNFSDKKMFWQNFQSLCSEIARSNDVFIKHHFDNHEGMIPIWAAVEVMSFGTLSKTIKNLASKTVVLSLAGFYRFVNSHGQIVNPSKDMLTSWIQSVVNVRNLCAHNSRLYNRSLTITPQILNADQPSVKPKYTGIYEAILAMKYLSPSPDIWKHFSEDLCRLLSDYSSYIELSRLNFPTDWQKHL